MGSDMAFNSALNQGESAFMREDMLASVVGESAVAILGDNSKCEGFEKHRQLDNCGLGVNNVGNFELGGGENRSSDIAQILIGGPYGNEGSEKHLGLANVLGVGQLADGNANNLPMVNGLDCEREVGRNDADGLVSNGYEQLLHLGVIIINASPIADVDGLVRDNAMGILRDNDMEKELDCESEVGRTALQGDIHALSNAVVEAEPSQLLVRQLHVVQNTSSPVREVSQRVSSQKGLVG
ncbi:ferrous iron transport protein B [Sesbania bispinosa]|nr:ferrous iron transport protein B [Sesbania bispinosa]